MFWFDNILCHSWLPEGVSGDWSVRRRVVEGSRTDWIRLGGNENSRISPPGLYTELFEGSIGRMSDDIYLLNRDKKFVNNAYGDILLTGLGLGITAQWLSKKPEVLNIDVVEISEDVIKLVSPYLSKKVNVIQADAYIFIPSKVYDFILHDCFEQEPREEDKVLMKKYAPFARWQGTSLHVD